MLKNKSMFFTGAISFAILVIAVISYQLVAPPPPAPVVVPSEIKVPQPSISQVPVPKAPPLWKSLVGKYASVVEKEAKKNKVSPELVAAIIHVESHAKPEAVSPEGAIGLMQLMPKTAWTYLRVNPWNPYQNIKGGTEYVASLIRMYHGDVRMALIAYNQGPTSLARRGPVQAAVDYADKVLKIEGRDKT